MREKIVHLIAHSNILAILAVVLATLCWAGENLVANQMSVEGIPPIALSFWRWTLAFLILFSFTGKKLIQQRKVIFQGRYQLLVLGFLGIFCANTLLYIAAESTQAVTLALIEMILPVITMILAVPLLHVFPKKRQLFGMGMAIPGLLTILSKGEWSMLVSLDFGRGDMIMFLAMCCWGLYTVLLKRFELPLSEAQLLTTLIGIGAMFLLPFYLWEPASERSFSISQDALYVIIYEILVDRIKSSQAAQEEAQEQFSSALEQFRSVVNFNGGDLEALYDQLNAEFEDSEASADKVRKRIRDVKDVSEALFEEWEAELELYSSGSLRRASQLQLNETRHQYKKMLASMEQSEKRMQPVLNAFRDQVLYLKHNLNARAIAALKGEFGAIKLDIDRLLRDMQRSIDESRKFVATLQQS